MLAGKSWDEWIAEYAAGHQHPVNRLTHTIGIPLIVVSLALFVLGFWRWSAWLFIAGWVLQFIGHWFEGKPPEFFKDWRFLLVGLRWWFAKLQGRA
jgi:uncharacterized membrane protein YGL010W